MTSRQRKARQARNTMLSNLAIGAVMGIAASAALYLPIILNT